MRRVEGAAQHRARLREVWIIQSRLMMKFCHWPAQGHRWDIQRLVSWCSRSTASTGRVLWERHERVLVTKLWNTGWGVICKQLQRCDGPSNTISKWISELSVFQVCPRTPSLHTHEILFSNLCLASLLVSPDILPSIVAIQH